MKENIKHVLSVVSFLSAVTLGFICVFIPPTGIIDTSVLWFTAQLLIFTSSILGIDFKINGHKKEV